MINYPRKPKFEVITPADNGAARRLITFEYLTAMTGIDESQTTVESFIDAVSAECARYCNLAQAGAIPATFGREELRATWAATTRFYNRNDQLLLPWRVPITEIEITADGVVLDPSTYALSGATVQFLGDTESWPGSVLVADYTAGWDLENADENDLEQVPSDLKAQVANQVKMAYYSRENDPNLRSESIPDIWSGSYRDMNGSDLGASGMLRSLEAALSRYRMMVLA